MHRSGKVFDGFDDIVLLDGCDGRLIFWERIIDDHVKPPSIDCSRGLTSKSDRRGGYANGLSCCHRKIVRSRGNAVQSDRHID